MNDISVLTSAGWLERPGILVLIWLALVILFIILELISLGLTTIWFAAGALAAGIAAMFGGPVWLQVILFIAVTSLLLFCTKGFAKRHLDNRIEKTNAEGLIGKTSVVIEAIDNSASSGKIKIGDIEWTARAVNETQVIPEGTKVMIREIKGVKCLVEPV